MSQTIACVPCETKPSSKAPPKEGHLRGMRWHNTGEAGRTALQSGNTRGKELHQEESGSCQGHRENQWSLWREERRGWEERRADEGMRLQSPEQKCFFRNINCIKNLNIMAWLNLHFKRPVWMLWRLLVKSVVKGGLVKRPAV